MTEEKREVTTSELDEVIKQLREAEEEYKKAKQISNDKHFEKERLRNKVREMLESVDKTAYEAEGVGRVSLVSKLKVKYPDDLENRKKFVEWIKEQYGEEGVLSYLSMYSSSLNSLYNELFRQASEEGDVSEFSIPGIGEPTSDTTVRFNKK